MKMYVNISCTYKTPTETISIIKSPETFPSTQELNNIIAEFVDKCKTKGNIIEISVSNVYKTNKNDKSWIDDEIKRLKKGVNNYEICRF